MKILFSKSAIKFLENLPPKQTEKVRIKIKELFLSVEEKGIIPYKELQIKSLEGSWKNFLRMRIGKIRVIFKIDLRNEELLIYEIDFRGNIYK